MALQLNTKLLGSELKATRTTLQTGSPIPQRSNKVTFVDPRFASESTKKLDKQYQNAKIFKGFYNRDPSIPKIIVIAPNGIQRRVPIGPRLEPLSSSDENLESDSSGTPDDSTEEYSPEKTKHIYGNTPKSFRSNKVVYPPSVVPVRQYIDGATATYIKLELDSSGTPDDSMEEYNPEKTEHVYGNTPKAFRSTEIVYPPSVVPVRQYVGGATTTYIKVDYLRHHPDDLLFICGTGPGMTWKLEDALPLRQTSDERWIYETHEDFKEFEYRLVLNKKIWQVQGGIVCKGQHKDYPKKVSPVFV